MTRPLRLAILTPVAALGVWAGLAGARVAVGPLVLQNVTPSLPTGLYVRSLDSREPGTVVAVRQPRAARAYLAGLGYPTGALLLKRIAAGPGERVCRMGDKVAAGARHVRVEAHDRLGVVLPSWTGCRRLKTNELFLLGDAGASFDSRYFGPVAASDVVGAYRWWAR